MATTQQKRVSGGARSTEARANKEIEGLERVGASLDQAQEVLGTMRADVQSGARHLVDDVDRMVREARRDLTKLSKALRSDVEDLQKAVRKPPARKRTSAARARPKATTAAKR
jgi:hypothetical protein